MYPVKYFLNTDYQEMEVLGVTGLFTNLRVDKESLPEGFYKYSLRDGGNELFSSIERNVRVNHSGDFICKEEFEFGENGFRDVSYDDWGFTGEPVDLDKFFDVDIKQKVAEALDSFMCEFDPYGYKDNLEIGETDMVNEIRCMFDDREQVEGVVNELSEICEENKFENEHMKSLARDLFNKVSCMLKDFPVLHEKLTNQISVAEQQKETGLEGGEEIEPEVSGV